MNKKLLKKKVKVVVYELKIRLVRSERETMINDELKDLMKRPYRESLIASISEEAARIIHNNFMV
ncbi:MAG: hypothetical protein Q4D56_14210 [Bacteroides sp.]|nr:hypothetical protein [Bacteroides sp.]